MEYCLLIISNRKRKAGLNEMKMGRKRLQFVIINRGYILGMDFAEENNLKAFTRTVTETSQSLKIKTATVRYRFLPHVFVVKMQFLYYSTLINVLENLLIPSIYNRFDWHENNKA